MLLHSHGMILPLRARIQPSAPQFEQQCPPVHQGNQTHQSIPTGLLPLYFGKLSTDTTTLSEASRASTPQSSRPGLSSLSKLIPQFKSKSIQTLLTKSLQLQQELKSPALIFHHLALAALILAENELNDWNHTNPAILRLHPTEIRKVTPDAVPLTYLESLIPTGIPLASLDTNSQGHARTILHDLMEMGSLSVQRGKDIERSLNDLNTVKTTGLTPNTLLSVLKSYQRYFLTQIETTLPKLTTRELNQETDFLNTVFQYYADENEASDTPEGLFQAIRTNTDVLPPLVQQLQNMLTLMNTEVEMLNKQRSNKDRLLERLDKAFALGKMSGDTRLAIRSEIERLEKVPGNEKAVLESWLTSALTLPWEEKATGVETDEVETIRQVLDADHYGLEKVKEQILDHFYTLKQNPNAPTKILCFVGPPGVGKTSISKSIAKALRRKFIRLSMDGITDEREIKGFARTYVGSMPGKFSQAMQQAGCINPLILVDEIDKVGGNHGDPKSNAAKSALLSILDPEQNSDFQDSYFNFPYPLNHVFFIATANYEDQIPPALRDRLEIIRLPRYTDREKLEIAKRHLLPQVLNEQGLSEQQLQLSTETLETIVQYYTREAGVRNLKRALNSIAKTVTRFRQESGNPTQYPNMKIAPSDLAQRVFLGPAPFQKPERIDGHYTGEVNGLAYTDFGGNTIIVQVNAIPSDSWKAGLITQGAVTGNVQQIMQESVQCAVGFVEKHHQKLQLDKEFEHGAKVNVHFPAASIPKDGPSAGTAIATALISALTNIPVRADIAMTGELDAKGKIRMIGGLSEKLDAAYRAGIRNVIIPDENQADLLNIPAHQLSAIEIYPVKTLEDVLQIALRRNPIRVEGPSKPTSRAGFVT